MPTAALAGLERYRPGAGATATARAQPQQLRQQRRQQQHGAGSQRQGGVHHGQLDDIARGVAASFTSEALLDARVA
jgi:hypothetical protein